MRNKILEVSNRKKKGFIITLEVLATITVMVILIMGNFTILQMMDRQKYMYNAAISVTSQAARWGGTNNTLYKTFNKDGMDIVENMKAQIKRSTGVDVELVVTPPVVTHADENIKCTLKWNDVGLWLWPAKEHTISLETESIVTGGSLLNQ